MGSQSTPSTTTQTTEPPAFIQPFLQHGAAESQRAYQTGGPQYYPGQTVVPFSPQTEAAMGLTEQRALQGSPVSNAAQQYATNTLQGGYLNKNPYLDATFNRAADQVQNRLQSGFAGSGRNIDAARPLAAQELNDLANQVYGGAYDAERQRMQSVLPFAGQLANQDYVDLQALGGVGAQVEDLTGRYMQDQQARYDYEANQPYRNLDQYLSRLGQYPGSSGTSTTPLYRNRTAGAAGGALQGAAMGAQYGGGLYGALAGAAIGGLLGGI